MLYNNNFYGKKYEEFIFPSTPYNEDINLEEIASIQEFYEKNNYIPEDKIIDFLNWIVYQTRINITNNLDSPLYSSFQGQCAPAQSFMDELFGKMNFKKLAFNIGDVLETTKIHALEVVEIPTLVDNFIVNKLYILDPTFRQFCLTEENRFERYNEEPRWAVKMSAPHPGYFFNLTDEGRNFANDLICYGYFEVNEETLKTYFDPFKLYITPKEAYKDLESVGKVVKTGISGIEYWNKIIINGLLPLPPRKEMNLKTPREMLLEQNKTFLKKLKEIMKKKTNQDKFKSYKDAINDTSTERKR